MNESGYKSDRQGQCDRVFNTEQRGASEIKTDFADPRGCNRTHEVQLLERLCKMNDKQIGYKKLQSGVEGEKGGSGGNFVNFIEPQGICKKLQDAQKKSLILKENVLDLQIPPMKEIKTCNDSAIQIPISD